MTLIRRLILALALMAGLPAFAQAPAPVPALPDAERRTPYTISASTCACNVNFALYGDSTDYQNWLEVWLNGVNVAFNDPTFGWTITVPTQTIATRSRPISDAILTFTNAQTGTVQIVGARRPRRVSQYSQNGGVPTRNFNQDLTDIIATQRELWDKTNDMTGRGLFSPPGNTVGPLPLPALCKGAVLGFDGTTGLTPICVSNLGSGNVTLPVVNGNLACFNGTSGALQDCGSSPAGLGLAIGVSPTTNGTNGRVLFDNNHILGEYSSVPVPFGGTGQVAFTAHCVVLGNGASALNCVNGSVGNSSQPLISQGSGLDPIYSALSLAAIVAGSQDTVLGYWGSTAVSAVAMNNCTGGLTYSTSTHTFGCNTGAGTGTVTSAQISAGTGISVTTTSGANPCTAACNLTIAANASPILLNTLTASGSATISDTTSLTGTYSMYELVFENIVPATAGGQCELQVHSGGSFQATSYVGAFQNAIGTGAFASSSPTTFIACGSASQNNIGPGISGRIRIHTPSSAAAPKQITGETAGNSTTPSGIIVLIYGYWNNSAAIDGFQVLMSAGNFSGVVKIYGYP